MFCFERLARLIAGKNGCMHELKLRKALGKELNIGPSVRHTLFLSFPRAGLKFPAALNIWADIYEITFLAHRLTVSSHSVIKQLLYSCLLQAEELNSIVGNAFRMAYAAQLQRQPTFQDVIASQLQDKTTSVENNNSRINWVRQSSCLHRALMINTLLTN